MVEMRPHLCNYDYGIANHFANLAKMLHPPIEPSWKTMTPELDPNELLKFFTQGTWRVVVVLLRLILSFLFQWKQPYKNVS